MVKEHGRITGSTVTRERRIRAMQLIKTITIIYLLFATPILSIGISLKFLNIARKADNDDKTI